MEREKQAFRAAPESEHQQGARISPEFYETLGLEPNTRQGIAYAGVKAMINKHCPGAKSGFDFGCGAGRSTRFLKQLGLEHVIGVDIDEAMLRKAMEREMPGISYQLIRGGLLPFGDDTFDLTFSGIVFVEIKKEDDVRAMLAELNRVTARNGTVIILTCTREGYVADSDAFQCLLTEEKKKNLKDGDPVPTRVNATGQVFKDYFWSDTFMRDALQKAELTVVEVSLPVATPAQYKATPTLPCDPHYVIYVCKRQEART